MKFSHVVALAIVLAVAHGTEARYVLKGGYYQKHVHFENSGLSQLINDMCGKISKATNQFMDKVMNNEVINSAQALIKDSNARICDLVEKVQAEAVELQDCVKPYFSNIEDCIKPLTDNFIAQVKPLSDCFYAQVKPLCDFIENLFHDTIDQTKYQHQHQHQYQHQHQHQYQHQHQHHYYVKQ